MIEIKTKGYATKLLPDEETLIVATAEMKNLASQPQRTKRVTAGLNTLIQQLSHSNQGNKRMLYDLKPVQDEVCAPCNPPCERKGAECCSSDKK